MIPFLKWIVKVICSAVVVSLYMVERNLERRVSMTSAQTALAALSPAPGKISAVGHLGAPWRGDGRYKLRIMACSP
jgi:hypothetical protein